MVKRIAAFLLWGFTAWYAMAYLIELTGGPEILGPLVGLAVGSLIAIDPRGIIWTPRQAKVPTTAASTSIASVPVVPPGYSVGGSPGR